MHEELLELKEEIAEIEKSNFEDISEFGDLVTVAFAFARMNGFNNEAIVSQMIEIILNIQILLIHLVL